jgi:hypothetical protein
MVARAQKQKQIWKKEKRRTRRKENKRKKRKEKKTEQRKKYINYTKYHLHLKSTCEKK